MAAVSPLEDHGVLVNTEILWISVLDGPRKYPNMQEFQQPGVLLSLSEKVRTWAEGSHDCIRIRVLCEQVIVILCLSGERQPLCVQTPVVWREI